MMKHLALATFIALILSPSSATRSLYLPVDVAAQAASPQSQPNMQDMMKKHDQMMAEMKAADAKLDALVKEMNAATGEAKVNAVAAVVSELVRQHKAMHERMGQMHQHMMGGRGMMMKK